MVRVCQLWLYVLFFKCYSEGFNYYFGETYSGYRYANPSSSMSLESVTRCARRCIRVENCTAVSYNRTGKICELHIIDSYNLTTLAAPGWEIITALYEAAPANESTGCASDPCFNNGTCNSHTGEWPDYSCTCATQWKGPTCREVQYWVCHNMTMTKPECWADALRIWNYGDYAFTPGCDCSCCEKTDFAPFTGTTPASAPFSTTDPFTGTTPAGATFSTTDPFTGTTPAGPKFTTTGFTIPMN